MMREEEITINVLCCGLIDSLILRSKDRINYCKKIGIYVKATDYETSQIVSYIVSFNMSGDNYCIEPIKNDTEGKYGSESGSVLYWYENEEDACTYCALFGDKMIEGNIGVQLTNEAESL
jgi:hypothetical protein